ncbi:unnamed protein product, partial [marine sediment metagenome]
RSVMNKSRHHELVVPEAVAGRRLDRTVADLLSDMSRNAVRRIIDFGGCWVNGRRTRIASRKMRAGDRIELHVAPRGPESSRSLRIRPVHNDDWIAVVDKPAGLVTAGTRMGDRKTVVRQVETALQVAADRRTVQVMTVHRLDREASGLLVLSLSRRGTGRLARQFKQHDVNRVYVAVVEGHPAEDSGTIDVPLAVARQGRGSRAVPDPDGTRGGVPAVTRFTVLERFAKPERTLLAATLETGRTHQIRAHLAFKVGPIVGDRKYGSPDAKRARRICLHAAVLGFVHPGDDRPRRFESEPPDDFWTTAGLPPRSVVDRVR